MIDQFIPSGRLEAVAVNDDLHTLTREPQPIADQWMAKCSCGWRSPVSFWEFDTQEAVFAEIDRRFRDHIDAALEDGRG